MNSFLALTAKLATCFLCCCVAANLFAKDMDNFSATATVNHANCTNNDGSIAVTVSGGLPPLSYSLDGINFQQGSVFNNLLAGNYNVTVKDSGGNTVGVSVTVASVNNLQISVVTSAETCTGDNGGIIVSYTGAHQPVQFQVNNGPYQHVNNFGSLNAGNYVVNVKDGYGCIASQTASISLIDNLYLDAGPDKSICEGKSTTLSAGSNGNIFSWSPGASLLNPTSLIPTAFPTVTTKYFITGKLGVCTKVDSLTVFVLPPPVANAGVDVVTCFGQNVQLQGSGGLNYQWFPTVNLSNSQVSNPYIINPQNSTSYTLTVLDSNGCKSLISDTVKLLVHPPVKVFAGNDTFFVSGQPVQLKASGIGNTQLTSFVWSPALGLNNPFSQSPVATLTQDMIYTVTGYNSFGCKGIDEIKISIVRHADIYVPNAFTPNKDGKNDILRALPRGIKQFRHFTIYNRFGERIFTTSASQTGWDGTWFGKELSSGVFVWMSDGIDYNGNLIERKGTVVLIR